MSEINFQDDVLGIFLTGGAANRDPDLSLGGLVSSTRMRGMGALVDSPIPAIRIDNVFPKCGEGDATLRVDANGDLRFTPPGGVEGVAVAIAAGESKIVFGVDISKAIQVFRESGLALSPGLSSTLNLRNAFNGSIAMKDVTDAQRAAGETTYRAFMLKAQSAVDVQNIRLWNPAVGGAQATFALGFELPSTAGDSIQTIADELTAPAAVVFVASATEAGALTPPDIAAGDHLGIWIRRVFPVGTVASQEDVQLAMKFESVA